MTKRRVVIQELDDDGNVTSQITEEVDDSVRTDTITKLVKGGSFTSATPNDVRPQVNNARPR